MPPLAASVPECQESLSILLLRPGCVRSRHLVRCLLAAKGAAWLRPWFFRRILRASKHSSKAAARGDTSSLPAAFRKCCETSSIWFVRSGCLAECQGLLSILPKPQESPANLLSRLSFAGVTRKNTAHNAQHICLPASCFLLDRKLELGKDSRRKGCGACFLRRWKNVRGPWRPAR